MKRPLRAFPTGHRAASRAVAAAVIVLALLGAAQQPAQAQFSSISDFGDSYADTGYPPGGAIRMIPPGFNCPSGPPSAPTCRFTGSTNFVDSLQAIYGLPLSTNYAVGGALTDTTNTLNGEPFASSTYPGFVQEIAGFVASGRRFSDTDLVAISITGNDQTLVLSTDTTAQIIARADLAAANAVAGVQQLVAAGARNIVWLSAGNSVFFPTPGGQPLTAAQHAVWANTDYQQLQLLLQPLAQQGVRIYMFDFGRLQARIAANPGQYGFASAGGCEATLGMTNCDSSPLAVQNTYFYFNAVHPTGAAMALIAHYMANQIAAPSTVVAQGSIASSIATNFATSTLDRLDAYRSLAPVVTGAAMATTVADSSPTPALQRPAPDYRWSTYAEINHGSGSLEPQFLSSGYKYQDTGLTAGLDYRLTPKLLLGAVFDYAMPNVTLDVQDAHNHVQSYQLGVYASYTEANWFADGLIAYGRQNFDLDRQGVIDTVYANTNANTFGTAAKTSYLVTFGPLRAGPISGFDYSHVMIDSYTESGDALVTMMVNRQNLDNLTGDAGFQLRHPFSLGVLPCSPFLNLTAEHDFLGTGRTVTTTQVTAPLLPVITPVPDNGHQTYGKIATGIAAALTENVGATINAATTFGRSTGNDFTIGSGIKVTF